MSRRIGLGAAVLAGVLALAGCQDSTAPKPGEIVLGASAEQARGHLAVAVTNAEAGAWELAAVHAGHPAEQMPTIERMVATRDPAAAAALRATAADVVRAAEGRNVSTLRAAVGELDRQLAAVPSLVAGSARAAEVRYQASVVATLVQVVAEEYGEGVDGGRVANLAEYQDGYAFLQRATSRWSAIEGGIDQDERSEIAAGLARLRAAMPGISAPSSPVAVEEVETLTHDVQRELRASVGAQAAAATTSAGEIEEALQHLDATGAALRSGDTAAAAASFKAFRSAWIGIEDAVRGRDRDAYRRIETDMATASSLLAVASPDIAAAGATVTRLQGTLSPLAATTTTYGTFDAAIILLREGFEALLVIAALLAFLVRSGNADKQRWIWTGSGAGVLASIGVALVITVVLSATTASGADPELLEGITGLFAAAMLVYVSFWLHSKASLAAWDRYIRDRTSSALERRSLLALAAIAFLAVLREGSETVLFYVGLASSIALGDLVLGLATGVVGLAVIGILMLGFGVRVPIRPFFLGTSVLVYYLAFKFIGSGIHALQVAGVVPATPSDALPDIGLLGVFPTWETTAVQIALLAAAATVLILRGGRRQQHAIA